MRGINANTGKAIQGLDHLRQSIRDILTTPLGSRVMRRDYGSRLFELIDAPVNKSTVADIYAATVEALSNWEPRLLIKRVRIESVAVGKVVISIVGVLTENGQAVTLEGISIS